MRLIFVALCDYEKFSTTKISRFTVHSTSHLPSNPGSGRGEDIVSPG